MTSHFSYNLLMLIFIMLKSFYFDYLQVDKSDFVDVNIIAFRRQNQMDISGNIVTPQDVLPSLKV